ncbi:TAP42-like protein [Phellopilus nigrolimitatus]|nr:TAP42-like protein [Phellopilus nigrolimitatus]
MSETSIPLQTLYSRALRTASKASVLPTIEDETQALHLFSTNETLEEVSTRDLIYMTVPFILAELESSARATQRDDRLARLRKAQVHFKLFISLLDDYHVLPEEEKKIYGQKSSGIADPAKRREVKIAQFKKEKEIKNKISALRARRGQTDLDMSNTYNLVDSLLPASTSSDEDNNEDVTRETTLVLLRLQWAQTRSHLDSIGQELELLANAPPEEPRVDESRQHTADDTWRIESAPNSLTNQQGPLLDVSGRPLRPFTILPAGAGERARMQGEVFRPDHRLPTMGIDEYLEEERRRGNIIDGGGPQSANVPTKKEQLALDAELDGTHGGEERAEEKRLEDERWAQYTDANPRGAGNTMNRG